MGARVRLRLARRPPSSATLPTPVEAVALVNSGYEPGAAELILPRLLADRLGLSHPYPPQASVETYASAGGPFSVCRVPEALEAQVLTHGSTTAAVPCDAVISDLADEVVMSDALGSRLRIVILDLERGTWAFRHELTVERPSEPRQTW